MPIYIYIIYSIYIVYRVLSIYRVLPGFREFAVFEKSKRFFILFFGWALQRGGQGPGTKYIYIMAIYLKTGVPENPLADGPQTWNFFCCRFGQLLDAVQNFGKYFGKYFENILKHGSYYQIRCYYPF